MFITQIRNATLLIRYAGKKLLIDPIFADKGTYPPFPSLLRSTEKIRSTLCPSPSPN